MDFHLFFSKWFIFVSVIICCDCQRRAALPISSLSLRQFVRSKTPVPEGRRPNLSDVRIIHYGLNSSVPLSYRLKNIEGLLDDADFHLDRPTVLYAHGYVELTSDESVTTVVKAYLKNGKYNILVLDWSNMAFGSYLISSLSVQPVATETGRSLWKLLKVGLSLDGLHLVGHSLGSHLVAMIARELATRNVRVPRLSALDPAYPGFYPGLLGSPMTSDDAKFVDVIHTDGGSYGAPDSVGHADFWPNEGKAKQPGCISASIPLSYEDFCSHWRSWAYWAESVTGGKFLSRQCLDYDSFLRGNCADADLVQMGINADNRLRGNFYLRTAAKKPYALAERGAE